MQRKITRTLYSYYFVCRRKLWYSAHNIDMEQDNDNVLIGRLIDENPYTREDKSVLIYETIHIDFFRKNVIHEVKKSNHFDEIAINKVKFNRTIVECKFGGSVRHGDQALVSIEP